MKQCKEIIHARHNGTLKSTLYLVVYDLYFILHREIYKRARAPLIPPMGASVRLAPKLYARALLKRARIFLTFAIDK